MGIEDLLNIQVTSVSKKAERLSQTASAIYVITQDDIRRSGATSIPEALRGVPGLHVARLNSSSWSISARGFNEEFANKMLVLVDGQSVYDPMFSGTFWCTLDTVIEDIDRIEVIRGPGATMWGANAVNGVINIITKSAADTQGMLTVASSGIQEASMDRMRFGGQLGPNSYYRIFGDYTDRAGQTGANGERVESDWQSYRSGFRIDSAKSERSSLTVQGDVYHMSATKDLTIPTLTSPYSALIQDNMRYSSTNLLTTWKQTETNGANNTLQAYYNHFSMPIFGGSETRTTWKLDYQRHLAQAKGHDVLWGVSYLRTSDSVGEGSFIRLNPDRRTNDVISAFLQDEITLRPEKLSLTLGSKLEHNDFSGTELQPNGRILWTPSEHQTLWAAASRACRTPSRFDSDGIMNMLVYPAQEGDPLPAGTPILLTVMGNTTLEDEDLTAYEAGYRTHLLKDLSFDVAAFYNKYENLIIQTQGEPYFDSSSEVPHLVVPLNTVNGQHGTSHGIEVASNWNVTNKWRLRCGYSTLKVSLASDTTGNGVQWSVNPTHQAYLHSSFDLNPNTEFNANLTHVGEVSGRQDVSGGSSIIPAYTRLDLALGWRMSPTRTLKLAAQNLICGRHFEMPSTISTQSAAGINYYAQMTWTR